MANSFVSMFKIEELRKKILFTFLMLTIFRLGTYVPVPGIDPQVLKLFFLSQSNSSTIGLAEYLNFFAGGAFSNFSIFMLGIMPYISTQIILQLLMIVIESLKKLSEDAEGRKKIQQYTRYGTIVVSLIQSYVVTVYAKSIPNVMTMKTLPFTLVAMLSVTTGSMFLVWIGDQITQKGIGNGISLIIFAGIVAGLPSAIGGTAELVRTGELHVFTMLILGVLILAVTAFVVFVERGQRRITVNYARRQQGRGMAGQQTSHLPLKLNMAGVIPPIFASSIILFPATVGNWFGQQEGMSWLASLSNTLSPGQPLYVLFYATAIIFFCFFYTALVFNARETADNLKRSGAFVPGIRPGEQTARYVDKVLTRLTFWGAIYITAVCLLPEFLILYWNVPFYFGGTSLLIIVIVLMDFMSQVQSHLVSHQYDSLVRKAHFKSGL